MGAQIRVMKLPARAATLTRSSAPTRKPGDASSSRPRPPKAFSETAHPVDADGARQEDRRQTQDAAGAEEEKVDLSEGEETCLALLVRYPNLRSQGLALGEDVFVGSENRQVFEAWRESEPEARPRAERCRRSCAPHLERIAARDLPPYDPRPGREGVRYLYGAPEKR